jgi:hypothetical protein
VFTSTPADQSVWATSASGAVATYPPADATDGCSAPTVTYSHPSGSIFPIGQTIVTVTAADAAGNTANASFSVRVKGTSEQIADLKALIQSWGIHHGIENSFISKLQSAQAALNRGDLAAGLGSLQAVINHANAQRGKKLTIAQADQIITDATRIRAVIEE